MKGAVLQYKEIIPPNIRSVCMWRHIQYNGITQNFVLLFSDVESFWASGTLAALA